MKDLDKKIEQALKDATGSVSITDEATVMQDIVSTFQGQYRNILILAWIKATAFTILLFYSVYQFFYQETMMGMLAYASLAIISTITMATIYIIFYVFLNKNITTREIKRLELQIALLTNKLEQR